MQGHCSLAAAEAQPFGESLLLLEAIYEERNARAKFEAALHGVKLR